MAKARTNAKALAQSKRHRRRVLTFWRMVRYGINNFTRNAWLTIAATAVMTITLLIIFTTIIARQVLVDTVADLQRKVDMSIYVMGNTPDEAADAMANDLRSLSNVGSVTYINAAQARDAFARDNKDNTKILEALNNSDNKFFGTLRITLKNINDTSQLDDYIKNNQLVKKYLNSDHQPSFAGSRRSAIRTLATTIDFAQKVGIGASAVFVAISSLIVFNTIRMAIFNRRDEIEMMKLIGANKGFIRGPFVVEAMVYGFVAGIFATGLGIVAVKFAQPGLSSAGVVIQPTTEFLVSYVPFVVVGMTVLGVLVGAVSSLLATRRYLKI